MPPWDNLSQPDASVTNSVRPYGPVAARLAPYMAGEKQPALKNYYILAGAFGTNIGVRPLDPDNIDGTPRARMDVPATFPDGDVLLIP